jgi:hypothetical protein
MQRNWVENTGYAGNDEGRAVALAPNGDLIVAGGWNGDFLVVAFTPDGDIDWFATHEADGTATAAAVDGDGNVIVAGTTGSVAGTEDILVVKFDADGIEAWDTTFDGENGGTDIAAGLALSPLGHAYVVGSTTAAEGDADFVTIKFDRLSGAVSWAEPYDGAGGTDVARAVAVDSVGNVLVTGESGDGAARDCLTLKYDSTGSRLWAEPWDGGSGDRADGCTAVATGPENTVVLTAYSHSATAIDLAVIRRLAGGGIDWATRYAAGEGETLDPVAVAVAETGEVAVAGTVAGDAVLDWLTLRFLADGTFDWSRRYDGSAGGVDAPRDVAVDAVGKVFVTGYADEGGVGHAECRTRVYDADGDFWAGDAVGLSGIDVCHGLVLDGRGGAYVGGLLTTGTFGTDLLGVRYCAGCAIAGECWAEGAHQPGNDCMICDPARHQTTWTINVGGSCDDGEWCSGPDNCDPVGGCTIHHWMCQDDGQWCNGSEYCDEDEDRCLHTATPEMRCPDDGVFCNGAELCDDEIDGCRHAGTPCPDDGAFCNGEESCDEGGDQCLHSGDPCPDDGLFCSGPEACDEESDSCTEGGNPCPDDGAFCNGEESCDEGGDQCVRSGTPCPDDGQFCTGIESCDEDADTCAQSGDPCPDDALYCTGTESCDETTDACVSSGDPCGEDETCDESTDGCAPAEDDDTGDDSGDGGARRSADDGNGCCGG